MGGEWAVGAKSRNGTKIRSLERTGFVKFEIRHSYIDVTEAVGNMRSGQAEDINVSVIRIQMVLSSPTESVKMEKGRGPARAPLHCSHEGLSRQENSTWCKHGDRRRMGETDCHRDQRKKSKWTRKSGIWLYSLFGARRIRASGVRICTIGKGGF